MRKILLSLALLTTVTSEDLDSKKHRPLLSEGEPQFWFARGSRFPWDLTHFEFDQSLKDKDVRRLQTTESSLNKISSHDLNRFMFNKQNSPNAQEERNHQKSDESSDEKRKNSLMSSVKEDFLPNQEIIDCTMKKCPQYFQNWRLLEPFYVDEPNWVQVNSENYDTRFEDSEPFFVTRGKRSLEIPKINFHQKQFILENKSRINTLKSNLQTGNIGKNENNENLMKENVTFKKIVRKRSENDEDNDEKKLLANIEKNLYLKGGIGKNFNYLHPRNKHSDILEILEEPFFISRGKKSNSNNNNYFYYRPNSDFSVPDYLWEQYLDQRLENFLSDLNTDSMLVPEIDIGDKERILRKIFNNLPVKRTKNENKKFFESNKKRNVLDEINLHMEPFYIARG
ncbi:uncharacterized protein LOC122510517 [Leptopilina heterotoma]|uniref:uncharacterized protein LOC122510517 n=1 Tax=Leptopilina heterotoma TaxID=63436 RepID=UPI001CA8ED32|nr:uncharacterized protein LOC122510517 [Leptopilina heterotoma]